MSDKEYNDYKSKILDLKYKENKNLNEVFDTSLGLINAIVYGLFYIAIFNAIFLVLFFFVSFLSVFLYKCKAYFNLLLSCFCCLLVLYVIYCFIDVVVMSILEYQINWGATKDFEEFYECNIVNKNFL